MQRLSWLSLVFGLLLVACLPTVPSVLRRESRYSYPEVCYQRELTGTPAPTEASAAVPLAIEDALGRIVTLPALPQRIVITGKGLFMIADAAYLFPSAAWRIVGLGDAGQGTSNFLRLIDPDYAAKQVLGREAGAEQIAALRPDLVLMKSYLAEGVGAPIEALGIPVIYIDFETPEQYLRDLAILGAVFGDEARAAEVAAFYQGRMQEIAATVKDAPRPRVLLLYYSEKDGLVSFNVPPVNWMQTRMVEMAGGEPVWVNASLGRGWTQVTLEQIAAWDADQIFIVSYFRPATEVVDALKVDPNWQGIRAVKEGNLHPFAADLYSWDQPDPRWILGLTWLAGKLHPSLFPSLDIVAEARTFYKNLYGLDEGCFAEKILPTFQGVSLK